MSTDSPRPAASGPHVELLAIAIGFAAIDLIAKSFAETRLVGDQVDLGPLDLKLGHNSGVAFGLGNSAPTWLVIAVTATVLGVIAIYGWRHASSGSRWQRIAGAAILGGAAANLIDRIPDGVVTDYLHTGWWPTFNLADTFIVLGAVGFCVALIGPDVNGDLAGPDPDASLPTGDATEKDR